MSFLLDTNIISESTSTKATPHAGVISWLNNVDQEMLYLSVISLQEIRAGVELLPAGKRRSALNEWLSNALLPRFVGNILNVDDSVADQCGRLVASAKRSGYTPELADALIAATAIVHGLTLVTMNRRHFDKIFPVTLFTP